MLTNAIVRAASPTWIRNRPWVCADYFLFDADGRPIEGVVAATIELRCGHVARAIVEMWQGNVDLPGLIAELQLPTGNADESLLDWWARARPTAQAMLS